jgi:signal transduction histidine kinase
MPSESETPSSPETGQEPAASAAERLLARLRFDLHDGPQQDIVLLAEDIRELRVELEQVMNGHAARDRVLEHVDGLQQRLVALDADLRRLAAFVRSPFVEAGSVPEALAELVAEFAGRSGIEPEVTLEGDFSGLSDSQQITLLNLIREALNNIREHSEATHVTIEVMSGPAGVEASVQDDGRGFDPDTTGVQAAQEGHLGLVSMYERVNLLGGQTRIDSHDRGPGCAGGPSRARQHVRAGESARRADAHRQPARRPDGRVVHAPGVGAACKLGGRGRPAFGLGGAAG